MSNLSPSLLAELNQAIESRHLQSVRGSILENATECLSLIAGGKDDYAAVGNTRFGGDPDLPVGMDWPIDPESDSPRYANFIGQINFAEVPRLPDDDVLPSAGLLYLFVRYMEGAAEPAVLDAVYDDGDPSNLERRPSPPEESLCDEYLVDLCPQRIEFASGVSIANYRRTFRRFVQKNTEEVDDDDGDMRRILLESDLCREGQIGQLLGFANAGDDRENLYRQLVLAQLGRRQLTYNDYWDSIEEYEAYIDQWRDDPQMVEMYQEMRPGVEWLTSNRNMIANLVDQWRLLLRLDSNFEMNLNINDSDPLYVFIRNDDLKKCDFSQLAGEVTQG